MNAKPATLSTYAPFSVRWFLFTTLALCAMMLVGYEKSRPHKKRLRRLLLAKPGKAVFAQPAYRLAFRRPAVLTFYLQRRVLLSGK